MKLRCTIVLDRTLTDQQAHEKYRTYDPHVVASEMQREAQQMTEEFNKDGDVEVAGIHVQPIYGT